MTTEKTYASDITPGEFLALQRHARKLRSDAVWNAFSALSAWFKGLGGKTTDKTSAPQDGAAA